MKWRFSLRTAFCVVFACALLCSSQLAHSKAVRLREIIAARDAEFKSGASAMSRSVLLANKSRNESIQLLKTLVEEFREYTRQYNVALERLPEINRQLSDFDDAPDDWPALVRCPVPQAIDRSAILAWRIRIPQSKSVELEVRCKAFRDGARILTPIELPVEWQLKPGPVVRKTLEQGFHYVVVTLPRWPEPETGPGISMEVFVAREADGDQNVFDLEPLLAFSADGLWNGFRSPVRADVPRVQLVRETGRTEISCVFPLLESTFIGLTGHLEPALLVDLVVGPGPEGERGE